MTSSSPRDDRRAATICDSDHKYYCNDVLYFHTCCDTIEVDSRWHEGGVDRGAIWWQRWITQDWRYDQPTNTWYFQAGWAPGVQRYNVPLDTWEYVGATRTYGNQAIVRLQNQYHECVGGDCYEWCSLYIDFNLSLATYHQGSGGRYGCLTPVY